MAKRVPRTAGNERGRPWKKGPSRTKVLTAGELHHLPDRQLARFKASVDSRFDAAALVEIVRRYQESGRPLPAWVPSALESWLDDFVSLAGTRRGGPWTLWARKYRSILLDAVIADHLLSNREDYGLTWAEAADEAADWFSGTPAGGGPDKMLAAYKRDRKRGLQRPYTHLEGIVAGHQHLTSRPYRADSWWARNQDRMGSQRGEWLGRPRLQFKTTSPQVLGRKRP